MQYYLAIDIDDTICQTAQTCMQILQEKFPSKTEVSVIDLLKIHRQPGSVPTWQSEQAREVIRSLLESEEFLLSLQPIEDAVETLTALSKQYSIRCYISSRISQFAKVTNQWLTLHAFPSAPLITRDPNINEPYWKLSHLAQSKWPSENIILIDDTVENILYHVPNYKGSVLLFDRWHNQHKSTNIKTVYSWREVPLLLEKFPKITKPL